MKIAIVCSHGGHLTETIQILEAFGEHEIFIATYHSAREDGVRRLARTYFTENMGIGLWKMFKGSLWALGVLLRERPQVIFSLGAEIAFPFFYFGKLLGAKTLYIESWCRVKGLSLTGKLVYPVADVFWVQWPQLLPNCGCKAEFHGAVI